MNESTAPDIAIIGAMKCATSTLHRYLAQHPGIRSGHTKELNFFNRDDKWAGGKERYLSFFPGHHDGELRLDSSPNYSKRHLWPESASRLHQFNPDVMLIYLVREPVERIRSGYLHVIASGREYRSPSRALRDPTSPAVQTSRYAWQLEPFLEKFSRDQLMVLRFDELAERPVPTVKRVFDFIRLDPPDHLRDVDQHTSAVKTRPSQLARLIRFRRARRLLRRVHPILADRPIPDVEFSTELSSSLYDYLRPDIETLQASGLVDVSDWLDGAHT